MSNACGESWSCKITRARPRWQEKRTHSERLKERAQGAAWRKDKGFVCFLLLEPDQKDKRQR